VFNTYLIVAATELELLTAVNLHWPNTTVPTPRISCHVSRCCCCVPATEPDSPSIYSMIELPSSRAQVSVTGIGDIAGQRIVIYCTVRRDKVATRWTVYQFAARTKNRGVHRDQVQANWTISPPGISSSHDWVGQNNINPELDKLNYLLTGTSRLTCIQSTAREG
jgi:hypothetical protein